MHAKGDPHQVHTNFHQVIHRRLLTLKWKRSPTSLTISTRSRPWEPADDRALELPHYRKRPTSHQRLQQLSLVTSRVKELYHFHIISFLHPDKHINNFNKFEQLVRETRRHMFIPFTVNARISNSLSKSTFATISISLSSRVLERSLTTSSDEKITFTLMGEERYSEPDAESLQALCFLALRSLHHLTFQRCRERKQLLFFYYLSRPNRLHSHLVREEDRSQSLKLLYLIIILEVQVREEDSS